MKYRKEEVGIDVGALELIEVVSCKETFTKLQNGDQYYNVIIVYVARDYVGQLSPDQEEVKNAKLFAVNDLPENTIPFIKQHLEKYMSKLN